MDVEEGQQEVLLSGGVNKRATSLSGGSSTLKTALQVTSMIVQIGILCALVAGVVLVAGTRSNSSQEEDGVVVDLVSKRLLIIFIPWFVCVLSSCVVIIATSPTYTLGGRLCIIILCSTHSTLGHVTLS